MQLVDSVDETVSPYGRLVRVPRCRGRESHRTLLVHVDPRGTRARSFADAVNALGPCARFPGPGPRTTHWLLLDLACGRLGPVARNQWRRQIQQRLGSFCADRWPALLTTTSSVAPTWLSQRPSPDAYSFGEENLVLRNCGWPRMPVRAHDMPVNDTSSWVCLVPKVQR